MTVAIWGTSWFAMRFQLGSVPELQSIAYRFLLASAILILWCLATRRRLRFGWRDHLFCAIQGTTLFWFNYFLFYLAASRIPSGLMAVCFSTIVMMNIAGGAIFFGTRAERRVWIGAQKSSRALVGVEPNHDRFEAGTGSSLKSSTQKRRRLRLRPCRE